jgi:hypothetical protein
MTTFGNNAKMNTSTTGSSSSSLALSGASQGCQSFAAAGVHDGAVVQYELVEGIAWERNQGVYSASGPSIARGTPSESSNGGAQISLSGGGTVAIVFTAEQAREIESRHWFFGEP